MIYSSFVKMTQIFQVTPLDYRICFLPKHHHHNPLNIPYFNLKKNEKGRQIPAVLAEQMPILSEAFPSSLMQHLEGAEHPLAALGAGLAASPSSRGALLEFQTPQKLLSHQICPGYLFGCVLTQYVFFNNVS